METTRKFKHGPEIASVSQFLSYVERQRAKEDQKGNHADFLFRGQSTDEPLVPGLARFNWHGEKPLQSERLILAEFARACPQYMKAGYDDEWDRLALAQHHGLPTRLLDWTLSATAALWFVVKDGPRMDEKQEPRDGVVWVLKPKTKDFINFTDEKVLSKDAPFLSKRTRIFRPRIIDQRISAQGGVFTVHAAVRPDYDKPFIALEINSNFSNKLTKMTVPASHFPNLRKQLHLCGADNSTMFPDLDGLCKHLQWRYTSGRK
jgi:hypothetical protein